MEEITREAYIKLRIQYPEMELYSTFSDVYGEHPIGYGCPAMDTEYLLNNEKILRIESRKSYPDEEWKYRYFLKTITLN